MDARILDDPLVIYVDTVPNATSCRAGSDVAREELRMIQDVSLNFYHTALQRSDGGRALHRKTAGSGTQP